MPTIGAPMFTSPNSEMDWPSATPLNERLLHTGKAVVFEG